MQAHNLKTKRIAICADDFGLNREVNDAIISLAVLRRISGIGVLVDAPISDGNWRMLRKHHVEKIDVGLHLNLTQSIAGSPYINQLTPLILKAHLGMLNRREICEEIHRQFECFEDRAGFPPDYVDGHQHVHIIPTVRDCLAIVLNERGRVRKPWVRCCRLSDGCRAAGLGGMKARILNAFDRRRTDLVFGAKQISKNRSLLGVYRFGANRRAYLSLVHRWLDHAQDADLIMVHPAVRAPAGDSIGNARQIEFEFLRSPRAAELLRRGRFEVCAMSQILRNERPVST